ncbi:MAG: hypothetical protein IJP03_04155 [Christensenellaceae bacterium]|nr:hypothetical protein [Christensenellaceae bacterium]
MKRLGAALLGAAMLLFGCGYPAADLSQLAVIKGVGLDAAGDARWQLTACVAKGDASGGHLTTAAEGDSVTEMVGELALSGSRQAFFGQNRVVALGSQLAGADAAGPVLALLDGGYADGREQVVIFEGEAGQLLDEKSDAFLPPEELALLVEHAGKSSYILPLRLAEAANAFLHADSAVLVPVCRAEEGAVRLSGMGVVQNGRLTATLTKEECWGAKWLTGSMAGSKLTLSAGGRDYGIEILQAQRKTQVSGGRLCIRLEFVFAALEQAAGSPEYSEETYRALQEEAARLAEAQVRTAISRGAELEADFLNLQAAAGARLPISRLPVRVEVRAVPKFQGAAQRSGYLWE